MPEDLHVREATEADVEVAGRICVEAYRLSGQLDDDGEHGYSRTLADARARLLRAHLLVAIRDGVVVGTVTLCPHGSPFREMAREGEMEFRFLAVAPSAWGTGVSEALIQACEDYARAAGAHAMVIGVRDTNAAAQSLYARHGFVRAPERDWWPVETVHLLGFQRVVGPTGLEPMTSSL